MKKGNELDLDLKLRMMRFLWYSGYFTRRNINLLRYTYGKKTEQQYTDIDVLGVRIDENLKQHLTICDCKSGITAKTTERIFWLAGVMKYLGVERGIFLRTQVMEGKYIDLAKRLEIIPLSLEQLSELEKAYNVESKPYVGAFNKDVLDKDNIIFNNLRENARQVYDYIHFKYWVDPVQQQITSLVASEFKINELSNMREEEKIFLQLYILSLLSISILNFSAPLLIISKKEKEYHVRENLLGGRIESMERRRLLGAFYDFMSKEISTRYQEKYPISKKDFMSHIYPRYLKYLLDLIERICLKPIAAVYVPKLLDILAYEIVLNKDKGDNIANQIFSYNNNFDIIEISKLTKDFITFGQRSGFISNERYNRLKDLMYIIEP